MPGERRANKTQVNVRESSGRSRDGWNRSRNMGLDLAMLTTKTGTSPETHVPGQSRPRELEKSPRGTDTRMRGTV